MVDRHNRPALACLIAQHGVVLNGAAAAAGVACVELYCLRLGGRRVFWKPGSIVVGALGLAGGCVWGHCTAVRLA